MAKAALHEIGRGEGFKGLTEVVVLDEEGERTLHRVGAGDNGIYGFHDLRVTHVEATRVGALIRYADGSYSLYPQHRVLAYGLVQEEN